MEIELSPLRSYFRRLAIAFLAGSLLVTLAAIAVGGHRADTFGLVAGSIVIVAIALPSAAIAAFLARRDVAVVLAGQLATIGGMFAVGWLL